MYNNYKNIVILATVFLLWSLTAGASSSRSKYFSKYQANNMADSRQQFKHIILKFKDSLKVRRYENEFQITQKQVPLMEKREIVYVNDLLSESNAVTNRLFQSFSIKQLDNIVNDARNDNNDTIADLNSYFQINIQRLTNKDVSTLIKALNQSFIVEIAYSEPKEEIIPFNGYNTDITLPGITPQLIHYQQYLYPAPLGVDLFHAWTQPGGDGINSKIIVYDNNLNKNHEDLPKLFYDTGGNSVDSAHGTAVLGILGAQNNKYGFKGGVYGAELGFQNAASKFSSHADLLLKAAQELKAGDFIVIEVAKKVNSLGFECPCNPTQANTVPLEYFPAEFDAIQTIVTAGIGVVAAAGNGCVDFDAPVFEGLFSEDNMSSGSIWVTASKADTREPTCYANYGHRIDFNSWGENVAALGHVRENELPLFDKGINRLYGANFGGSSSATPIVASCLASLQSQYISKYGFPVNMAELKSILSENGQIQEGIYEKNIGMMPNMSELNF